MEVDSGTLVRIIGAQQVEITILREQVKVLREANQALRASKNEEPQPTEATD